MNKKLLIGADPEVFFQDKQTGKIVSAIDKIGGTKEYPYPIGEDCSVQEDNVLAEFNIPPTNNVLTFIQKITYCKKYLSTIAASYGAELLYASSAIITDEIALNPKSKEFGCEPSQNSIFPSKKCENPPEDTKLRTSGFHIHFGYPNSTEIMNRRISLSFELLVTFKLHALDIDIYNRRSLYGKFGEYRTKEYGVECRSLGGSFLRNNTLLTNVFNYSQKAFEFSQSMISLKQLINMVDYCIGENGEFLEDNYNQVYREVVADFFKKKRKIVIKEYK